MLSGWSTWCIRPLSVKLAGSAIMAWSDWARLTKLIKCFFLSPQDILFVCVVYWGKGRWGRRACRGLLTDCPPLDHPLYIQLPAGKIICGIKNFQKHPFWQRKVSHWTSWYEIMHNLTLNLDAHDLQLPNNRRPILTMNHCSLCSSQSQTFLPFRQNFPIFQGRNLELP